MDPASVTQALKEAYSIVDEILPLEEFGRGKSPADRMQLRSVSLPLVLGALLAGPDMRGSAPADDEVALTSGQAGRLMGVDPKVVISYVVRGFLPGFRTPGGQWRFKKGDVRRFRLPADANVFLEATGDDVVRMRDDEKTPIAVIAAKMGLSRGTISNMYRRAKAAQALRRLEEFKAPGGAAEGASPGDPGG